LLDYPGVIVCLSCPKCRRAGQYRKQNLIERYEHRQWIEPHQNQKSEGTSGEGNIHQLVVSPPDAPVGTITTEPGLLITKIELPETMSGLDLSDPERSSQQLSEVLQHFQVEVGAKAKLIRKKP